MKFILLALLCVFSYSQAPVIYPEEDHPTLLGLEKAYMIFVYIVVGFAALITIGRWFNLYRLNQNDELDRNFYLSCGASLLDTFADAFFILNSAYSLIAWYLYMIKYPFGGYMHSKAQGAFEGVQYAAMFSKLIALSWFIYKQSNAEIFFVDWERPKGYVQIIIINIVLINQLLK
ncbi:MAG: hypothetical protein EZS28_019121 [Streblomastix strix]|uniref:Uncharacterized protein n=1 Tax=Streblomastix strix TaxID=222440 RepID=A0A5J4VRW8_9EUKA|nr:MAG: hypothetical protein EZS28_019121 [Streblomastix strix]